MKNTSQKSVTSNNYVKIINDVSTVTIILPNLKNKFPGFFYKIEVLMHVLTCDLNMVASNTDLGRPIKNHYLLSSGKLQIAIIN